MGRGVERSLVAAKWRIGHALNPARISGDRWRRERPAEPPPSCHDRRRGKDEQGDELSHEDSVLR